MNDDIKDNIAAMRHKRIAKDIAFSFITEITAALVVNTQGIVEWSTSAANNLFGYFKNELNMKPISILIPEELRAKHDEHFAGFINDPKARNMGEKTTILPAVKKDGSKINVRISLFPVVDEYSGDFYVIAKIWKE